MKRTSLLSAALSSYLAHSRLRGTNGSIATRLAFVSVVLVGLVTLSLLYVTRPAYAATCNSTGTGNWNTSGTWSCGHAPTSSDDVTILGGHTISFDASSATVSTLTTNATGVLNFNSSPSDSL